MESLIQLDHQLFYLINNVWSHSVLDVVLPFLRDRETWIPLYVVMLIALAFKHKWQMFFVLATAALCFGCADYTAASILKPWVGRLRPCQQLDVLQDVIVRVGCGGSKSFPSAHATNHFAIAVFFGVLYGAKYKWIWPVGIIWAASISYSQVYVAKHFPIDIICGAALGTLVALIFSTLLRKFKPQLFT